MWVLTSHYRTPLTYTEESLEAARKGAERLRIAARTPDGATGDTLDAAPLKERFIEAMDDDLNTSKALAALFDLARDINRARDDGRAVGEAQQVLLELADVLGMTLTEPEAAIGAAPFIELLISLRGELRHAKQFELADRVRDGLTELGIALEDSAQGTTWRRKE
jgi:cysteinyl-tRNA synthetase